MKKIHFIIIPIIMILIGIFVFFTSLNNVVLQISLDADESPFLNDIYNIGQLEIVKGDIEIFEEPKLLIVECLPSEKCPFDDVLIEIGDQIYEITTKNKFITADQRIGEKYGAYIWFTDEGGYPVLKIK